MTEFAVAVTTFTLLAIGTLTIAGYQETQRRLVVGSRHAAFVELWRNGRASAQTDPDAIYAAHFQDAGFRHPVTHQRWVEREGFRSTTSSQGQQGPASVASEGLLRALRVASGFMGGGFDLRDQGLRSVTVTADLVRMPRLPEPFAGFELPMRELMVLLPDAWSAAGSMQTRGRTAGLVPTGQLGALGSLWRPLAVPLSVVEPGLDQLCLGLIEPEQVPEDRLGPALRLRGDRENCR